MSFEILFLKQNFGLKSIFYRQISQQYELVSYGQSVVDGVQYGVDFWKMANRKKKRTRETKSAIVTRGIKEILKKNKSKGKFLHFALSTQYIFRSRKNLNLESLSLVF